MPAKIRSAGNLSQNPQEAIIATYICFLTNFTELELTNTQILGGPWFTRPMLQRPPPWQTLNEFCFEFCTQGLRPTEHW